jgi:hypothetical protein
MRKRNLFSELQEGFSALAKAREGKISLHQIQSKSPKTRIDSQSAAINSRRTPINAVLGAANIKQTAPTT